MEKMKVTAKKVDVICHVLQVCSVVGVVCALVGLLLIGAFFAFHLAPEQVGSGYNAVDIGYLELELAQTVTPEPANVLKMAAVDMAMGVIMGAVGWLCLRCVRNIVAPMKEGLPFQAAASAGMKKLALLTVILGVLTNVAEGISLMLTVNGYRLTDLLVGESITGITVNYTADLTFLVVAAVLLLLSYIFRYGEQLQQLSDETL